MYELSLTSSRSFGSVGLPFDETILKTCPGLRSIRREMASFGEKREWLGWRSSHCGRHNLLISSRRRNNNNHERIVKNVGVSRYLKIEAGLSN
jgi:hypothetical protein